MFTIDSFVRTKVHPQTNLWAQCSVLLRSSFLPSFLFHLLWILSEHITSPHSSGFVLPPILHLCPMTPCTVILKVGWHCEKRPLNCTEKKKSRSLHSDSVKTNYWYNALSLTTHDEGYQSSDNYNFVVKNFSSFVFLRHWNELQKFKTWMKTWTTEGRRKSFFTNYFFLAHIINLDIYSKEQCVFSNFFQLNKDFKIIYRFLFPSFEWCDSKRSNSESVSQPLFSLKQSISITCPASASHIITVAAVVQHLTWEHVKCMKMLSCH